jgi:GT2 family glycosyltransferase
VIDQPSNTVYIIIPVHNRKAVTLKCLEHLNQQGDLERYRVVVVDDGSTDHTQEAIQSDYPAVIVLPGDGNLWWTGAICLGMKYAVAQGAEYLIWLNDDCLPQPGAIAGLLDLCKTDSRLIVGGQAFDPNTHQPSYGGVVLQNGKIRPIYADKNCLVECDGLNGNLVCFPKNIAAEIGYPNQLTFPHYHGDTAYTHAASRKGYRLAIWGNAISHCQNDHIYLPSINYWLQTERSPFDLWRELFKIQSANYWKAELSLYVEFFSIFGFWFYLRDRIFRFLIITMIVLIFPFKFRDRLVSLLARGKTKECNNNRHE